MRRASAIMLLVAVAISMPLSIRAEQEQNNVIGVFTEAPASSKFTGAQLTITGLSTSEATVVWPDGYDTKMKKIFENSALVVLQSVAPIGSIDTIYIETKNKKFLVLSVGAMAAAVKGNSVSVAQYRGYTK